MNRYYIQNKIIHLIFPFNIELIKDIKEIEGRKYSGINKEWIIPISLFNGDDIDRLGSSHLLKS